jgi:hypothetical protein
MGFHSSLHLHNQNPIPMNAYEKPAAAARIFSLQHLVNELLRCYSRVKRNHRQCFINDVPANMVVSGDQVAALLGDLFEIVSTNPGYIPVHISATASGKLVKLFVKDPPFLGYCFPGAMAA